MRLKSFVIWLLSFFAEKPLSRAAIIAAKDGAFAELPIPEWGGTVHLQGLTVEHRLAFLAAIGKMQTMAESDAIGAARYYLELQCGLLVSSIVDESGARCFSENDVAALVQKSPTVINRIYDEVMRLNSFKTSAVEDEAKN